MSLVLRPAEARQPLTLGAAGTAPTVSGPAHALAGWLTGRSPGDSLTVTPAGPLPTPPAWL